MVPTTARILDIWNTYDLPESKRNHSQLVASVACWFAEKLHEKQTGLFINIPLLRAAALLHDIDKNIEKKGGEKHPDTGVRILCDEGFPDVADIVRTHSLHAIRDTHFFPKTIEQRLLFLADKMVKHSIITVDERFSLWRQEPLSLGAISELDLAYPKVKQLEQEICSMIGVVPEEVGSLVNQQNLSTMVGRNLKEVI